MPAKKHPAALVPFADWWADKQGYISEIVKQLNEPLSDDAEELWVAVVEVERYLGYAYLLLARADHYLDQAQYRELQNLNRLHGQKGMTSYEKNRCVDAAVGPEREARDTIKGVIEAIQRRVSLAQSRMSLIRSYPKTES